MNLIRRKLVRLHLEDPHPSVEGILVPSWGSHYKLVRPEVLVRTGETQELQGSLYVPRERVVFVQQL